VSDGVQPGTEVDEDIWKAFREEVKRRRGGVRGHIRTELENALRDYIHGGDTTPADIDQRLQRIEAAVGAAGTDGGTDTFEQQEHTHAPPETKPSANAPSEKKLRYLAECVRDNYGSGSGDVEEIPKASLREVVKDEYGFRSDTAKRYVQQLIDHFGLVDHPTADPLVCTPQRREKIIEEQAEQDLSELDD